MTQGEETWNNVLIADVVKEVLVQILHFTELPHCLVGKEGGPKGDIMDLDLGVFAQELEKIQCSNGRNSTAQGVSARDDSLAIGNGCAVKNVFHPDSLL